MKVKNLGFLLAYIASIYDHGDEVSARLAASLAISNKGMVHFDSGGSGAALSHHFYVVGWLLVSHKLVEVWGFRNCLSASETWIGEICFSSFLNWSAY